MKKNIKKKVTKKEATVLNPMTKTDIKSFNFPLHSKFMLGERLYTVRASYSDSNTEWRKVIVDGNEEIIMLKSLMKDKSDPTFVIIQG